MIVLLLCRLSQLLSLGLVSRFILLLLTFFVVNSRGSGAGTLAGARLLPRPDTL